MVSGAVVPPTIDLTNEELILSHFHASMLMELGLSDMRSSAADLLDVTQLPAIPLKADVELFIREQLERYAAVWADNFRNFTSIIAGIESSYWYSAEWFFSHVKGFLTQFDKSFNRCRELYRTANRLIGTSRAVLDDPAISSYNVRKQEAKRDENVGMRLGAAAERQPALLGQ